MVEARFSVVDGRIALFKLNGRQPQSWFVKLLEGHERILGCDLDDPGTAPVILVIVEVMLHSRQKPCRGRRKQVHESMMMAQWQKCCGDSGLGVDRCFSPGNARSRGLVVAFSWAQDGLWFFFALGPRVRWLE